MAPLLVVRAGLVPYEQAWAWQRELHARRRAGEVDDLVLLLEHPSVYTAGRRTLPEERPFDGTPVLDVDRGGKITWHGPGQLVGYPIVGLPPLPGSPDEPAAPVDVVAHVRRIEQALIEVCDEFGVPAQRVDGRSGVWVPADGRDGRPARKIAAIGVRVSGRVTMHGFALNVDPDLGAFDRIVPCGIRDAGVTSLAAELGKPMTLGGVAPVVESALARRLMADGPAEPVAKSPADLGLA